jgi:hypothetical protein
MINIKNHIESIIFILILLAIYHFYLIFNICNGKESLDIYEYRSEDYQNGDVVILILGGTHGDEPAGTYAIKLLQKEINLNKLKLKRCKLILIPAVNYCSLRIGFRLIPEIGDFNRKYPTSINDNPSNNIIKKIVNIVKTSDFIVDFHEGWGFNRKNSLSLGSTLSPSNTSNSFIVASNLLNSINKKLEGSKRYRILTHNDELIKENNDLYAKSQNIKGTLKNYCNIINKNYILIETSGKYNIQPINIRINQNLIFLKEILEYYHTI